MKFGQPLYRASVAIALSAIFFALLVPVWPSFPASTQLDNSWIMGLNEALAIGLAFGERLVFTFGPYASVYTREYHPATDSLTLFGGALLAACYALLFMALATLRGRAVVLLTGVCALVVFRQLDALLFLYPVALSVLVFANYLSADRRRSSPLSEHPLLLAVLLIPFGMLPLIKGSALLGCASIGLLCFGALLAKGRRREAMLVGIVPVASCAVLWLIAGQPLAALPWFFINLLPIISGFTDAMSGVGPSSEVYVYLAACLVVLVAVASISNETHWNKAFLLVAFALHLFLAFKAGFVRHDSHTLMAAAAIGMSGLLTLLLRAPAAPLAVLVAFGAWAYLDSHHTKTATDTLVKQAVNPFLALKGGWEVRTQGLLPEMAERQLAKLSAECPVEKLDGTVDIYSYRQGCLIASGARWSPRPVFQSYSAYTPRLARLNAEHLRGPHAPDHVLFRVEPIDLRLPALEDGPSWPALLQLYEPRRLDEDLVYLSRHEVAEEVRPRFIEEKVADVNSVLSLPLIDGLLFAEVELGKTVLGRLVSSLFKPTAPVIEVTLASGAVRTHRFVPGMAAAGFVLSPYVANTRDFVLLMAGDPELNPNAVRSMRISVSPSGRWLWSASYSVRLSRIDTVSSMSRKPLDPPFDALPSGGKVDGRLVCDGNIDRINGVVPAPISPASGPRVTLDGWTSVAPKEGLLADQVLVAVTGADGKLTYFRTRTTPRSDVRDHFQQPGLLNSGFEARIDLTGLGEEVTLQLAHIVKGRLLLCDPARKLRIEP